MKKNKVHYLSERKKSPKYFDKRSFRTIKKGKHRLTVGCKKGKYSSKKGLCKTKVEVQRILHPVKEKKSNPPIRALLKAIKMKKASYADSHIRKVLSKEFKLSSSEIDYILKRIGDLLKETKKNPVDKKTLIYDSIETITAKKGKGSLWPSQRFKHEFKNKSHASIFGLPDGSLLIKGKKPLWKNINYPDKNK